MWAGIWTLWAGVIGGWAAVIAGELAPTRSITAKGFTRSWRSTRRWHS